MIELIIYWTNASPLTTNGLSMVHLIAFRCLWWQLQVAMMKLPWV
jgi:hypothetical protein